MTRGKSEAQVSLYPYISEKFNGHQSDITIVLNAIREGKWRKQVEAVRALPQEEYDIEKLKLPYFTPSGIFTKCEKSGLIAHSGYIALDVDKDKGKNPDVHLGALRDALKQDSYVYSFFTSVGGNGLAVIYRIPTEDHNGSFRALQRYFIEQYGVKVDILPDVCRARIVSYDPDLYLNENSDTWEEVLEEQPRPVPVSHTAGMSGIRVHSNAYGQIALDRAINKILQAADGEKHTILNKVGFMLGGYVATGYLSEYEAIEALTTAIEKRGGVKNWAGALRTIRVSVRDGHKKPILPEEVEYQVRTQRNNGSTYEQVGHSIAVSQGVNAAGVVAAVKEIFEHKNIEIKKFWRYVCTDEKKDKWELSILHDEYLRFLEEGGFGIYRSGKSTTPVRVVDNIVHEVNRIDMKRYVCDYIESLPFEFDNMFRFQLDNKIKKEHRNWFDEGLLEFLHEIGNDFLRDTRKESYFFFKNVFVRATATTVEPMDYKFLPGKVWATQVLDRDFTYVEMDERPLDFDFARFASNITGGDESRFKSLMTTLGYMLHTYKNRAEAFAPFLCDEHLGNGPSGRTGKGILLQAIRQVRNLVLIDGKNFNLDHQFAFQAVSHDTQVVAIDDVDVRKVPFIKLFSILTEDLTVERKNQQSKSIPFEESPKFIITANDAIVGDSDSYKGRKVEIEIAPYYRYGFSPADEMGREFFRGWDAPEWLLFDNFMVFCCQHYLNSGVIRQTSINLDRRKLIQLTHWKGQPSGVPEYLDGVLKDKEGNWLPGELFFWKSRLYRDFLTQESYTENEFSQRKFTEFTRLYAKLENLDLTEGKKRDELGVAEHYYIFKVQL